MVILVPVGLSIPNLHDSQAILINHAQACLEDARAVERQRSAAIAICAATVTTWTLRH